jgi:hypothetical protein
MNLSTHLNTSLLPQPFSLASLLKLSGDLRHKPVVLLTKGSSMPIQSNSASLKSSCCESESYGKQAALLYQIVEVQSDVLA